MKKFFKKFLLLPALIGGGVVLMPAGHTTAQTFTTLHDFSGSDGSAPNGRLVLWGNMLYGTTAAGGSSDNGTVFRLNADGTGFTNLHSFPATVDNGQYFSTNSGGAVPLAGLILSGNILYGTTDGGGSFGAGTVFRLNADGTGFTNLHSFAYYEGIGPNGDLILLGNTLYGTTDLDYGTASGKVFALNTNGTGFTTLHTLYGTGNSFYPAAGLIVSGNTLYGTTDFDSGPHPGTDSGTVFAVNINGTNFTTLHSFTTVVDPYYSNSDGAYPGAGLILSGNTLYGTTEYGGVYESQNNASCGILFKLNTDGTGFTNLHSFAAARTNSSGYDTNSEGLGPVAGLIVSGNTLYGMASLGGNFGSGTVFALNTNGADFTTLYSFAAVNTNFSGINTNSSGAGPLARLILSGNTLYGTASQGGGSGKGTVFSLSFTPQLAISHTGTNVVLNWPTNLGGFDYSSFTLQSTMNSSVSAAWTNVSPVRVVVNGQNVVTNSIVGALRFYRLTQ